MTHVPPETPVRPALPPELDPRQPAAPPKPGRWRRVLWWTAVVTSAVVLVASTALWLGFRHFNGRLSRIDIRTSQDAAIAPAAAVDGAAQNFLVVGSDTREAPGTTKGFGAGKGSPNFIAGQRSDTIMLLHVPGGNAKATIVSFPRDSWVAIPKYRDSKGVLHAEHTQRINTAFSLGGAPLLIRVVERLSGLRVDHYVQVDFAGFQSMVNALGGVRICVRTPRADKDSGDYLTAGTHNLDGKRALAFVRNRKALKGGDIDRIANQQYFLSVLLGKVLSTGTLANPLKINAFLNAATRSLTVDRDLSFNDMRKLALRMRRLDPKSVRLLTAPIKDANARVNGAQVVLLDDAKMKTLFDGLKDGKAGATPTPSVAAPRVTIAPSAVSVRVLNGAGVAGLATKGAADLRGVGFRVSSVGNAGSGATTTVIRHGPTRADSARTLAAAVPGATVVADPSLGSTVTIVLGSDYAGVRRVTVGPAPSPRASAPAGENAADAAKRCAP